MRRFRPRLTPLPPVPVTPPDLLTVGRIIDELLQPGHFFVAGGLRLHWHDAKAEDVPWEVFRGRLVGAAQTRQQARFLSWHISEEGADAPMLSVRLDVNAGVVHVTRGILCYVWEGYDSGGGVIESREVQRWTQELVGSAEINRFPDLDELRDELICLIWQAVVGTSKLPLHSVEAPLPAFSLGQLHYEYRPWTEDASSPVASWEMLATDLARNELCRHELARLLEAVLRARAPDEVLAVAVRLLPHSQEVVRLLRLVFNDISLSPHTGFVDTVINLLGRLHHLQRISSAEYADFLGHLLRQLGRHLTAYDLVTFHHRGANYPDALLLDALLQNYIWHAKPARTRELFTSDDETGRRRRRALRQACLLRCHYQGHQVPDAPTSPGENARVLPAPHRRVPQAQLIDVHQRQRRLFPGKPLTELFGQFDRQLLAQSIRDLDDAVERAELGIGLFIDRPLGYGKAAGEPDLTPLLAHEAYSFTIAQQRLEEVMRLARDLSLDLPADFATRVDWEMRNSTALGLPADRLAEPARPTASLSDFRLVAIDFMIRRTLPGGLGEMLDHFDFDELQSRYDLPILRQGQRPRVVAMVQSPRGPVLGFFDDDYECRLEAAVDASAGYFRRAGVEVPVSGLLVLAVDGVDVSREAISITTK